MRALTVGLASLSLFLAAGCGTTKPEEQAAPPPAPAEAPPVPAAAPPSPPPPAVPAPSPPVIPDAPRPAAPAPPPPPAPARRVVQIKTDQANLRESPGTRGKVIRVLRKGTKLTVLEAREQWFRVRLDDGREGWVAESVTAP
ncbi:MAG: SH3 domain-containing protein [Candidatus Rokubacteria bacterium]|nr:SH3 domain-containing protein [Candidatus Rokubacteria bacterium]